MTPSLATSPSMAFSPYLNHMGPGMGLMPELLPSTPLLVPGSPTGLAAMANGTSSQKHSRTDKLEVREPACSCCAWPQHDGKQTLKSNSRSVFLRWIENSRTVRRCLWERKRRIVFFLWWTNCLFSVSLCLRLMTACRGSSKLPLSAGEKRQIK